MKLSWCPSSSAEDRFETWIAQRHQTRVLAGETAPVAPCPDENFLQDLARTSKRIKLSDPRVDHAANCPTCMSRLLALRREDSARRRKLVLTAAVASCLVIAVAVILMARYRVDRQSPVSNMAVVSQTVDLWDAGTIRGEQTGALQSVLLPAALVKVTVILPRFSSTGRYAVAVTRDQMGNDVLAQGSGVATSDGDKEQVSINLDLRKATTGAYFLSTTHEQDQASYYYPLRIR
jgi:hypothetical protein